MGVETEFGFGLQSDVAFLIECRVGLDKLVYKMELLHVFVCVRMYMNVCAHICL